MLKLIIRSLLTGMLALASVQASASVILGADSKTISTKARSIEADYSQKMRQERMESTYTSTLKMRETRKVGAGVAVGGALGTVGFNMEFNFEDADGVVAGFGTGSGYNSVQLSWKHAFEGDYLAPYFTAGYSRWYNSNGDASSVRDSSILQRVLTGEELRTGRFGTDFLNAAVGLQYNQLSGELRGFSVYGELMAMYEAKRSILLPTGAIGTVYYF